MELIFRHFWIALVVVNLVNGRMWWSRVQSRIRDHPELEPGYCRLHRGYLLWTNLPWLAMGLLILSGKVPSIVDFLRPSEGNPFVLAWWGLLVALLCLGTGWIVFGGGAETLERYPGVYMVPEWPASKLRIFWLGLVAWNVVIGTLLFLGFPGALADPGRPREETSWLWALLPAFVWGGWLLVSLLLSTMGGWRALADPYLARSPFSGKRFHLRSAQFGGYVNYGGCLTLGSGPTGLYLAVLLPFRMGHPPLLVPWSDIAARETRSWLFPTVELRFARVPGASIRLSRRLARALFEASGTQVQVQPAA